MTSFPAKHVVVYRSNEYFSAWPFNGGLWQFADGELLAGFVRGGCNYQDEKTLDHGHVDRNRGEHVTIRSFDGGNTWPAATLQTVFTRPDMDERGFKVAATQQPAHCFDPRADGYCLLSVFGLPPINADGTETLSLTLISTDRGHTWGGPVRLPPYRFTHLSTRPSYCVAPDGTLLLFSQASRDAGGEASAFPVVFGSRDGGASWGLVAEVELKPAQPLGWMPNPVVLGDGTILIAVRRQYDGYTAYTQIYASHDGGLTWGFHSRVNLWGAPASLTVLPDDRLVCVYGYRRKPWGIRARISADHGKTWGEEIVLRDDGACWDLGYPRTQLRPDGKLVTVYYFTCASDPTSNGGVRHIAATVWEA